MKKDRSEKTPRQALRRAAELKREATKSEARALREALRASGGFEARAAKLLGISRTTLRYMLQTRHQTIQKEAAGWRRKTGYRRGKPQRPT